MTKFHFLESTLFSIAYSFNTDTESFSGVDSGRRDGGRGLLHRMGRTSAPPDTGAVRETRGGAQGLRGAEHAPAPQSQHSRRHPADFCLVALDVPDDGRAVHRSPVGADRDELVGAGNDPA